MRNVRKGWLVKCIRVLRDDFNDIISNIYDGKVFAEFCYDGIAFFSKEDYAEIDCNDVTCKLSEYFGVAVESIHIDDDEFGSLGVWIEYTEEE